MANKRIGFYDENFEIPASAEAVFALLVDVDKWPTWWPGVSSAFHSGQGQFGPGHKIGFVPAMPEFRGMRFVANLRTYTEGRCFEWGVKVPLFDFYHGFSIEPLGPERCRVHHYEYATGLLAHAARLLSGLAQKLDRSMSDAIRAHFASRAGTT